MAKNKRGVPEASDVNESPQSSLAADQAESAVLDEADGAVIDAGDAGDAENAPEPGSALRNPPAMPVDALDAAECASELERLKDLDSETQGLARQLADLRIAKEAADTRYNAEYNRLKVRKFDVDAQRNTDMERVRQITIRLAEIDSAARTP